MRHSIQCRTSLASACQASAAAPGASPSRFKVPVLRPERLTVLVFSTNSTSFAAATPATHCFTASLLARQVAYGLYSAYTSSQSKARRSRLECVQPLRVESCLRSLP